MRYNTKQNNFVTKLIHKEKCTINFQLNKKL